MVYYVVYSLIWNVGIFNSQDISRHNYLYVSSCFRVCGVFLIDSHFMVDGGKFISGAMAALSVMVNLEVPHVNVLSKVNLRNFPKQTFRTR